MRHKEKKAWLRIVEAVIAIMIVISAVTIIISRQNTSVDISDVVYDRQEQILNVISKNDVLRTEILAENNAGVDNYITQVIPPSWEFSTNICEPNAICSNPDQTVIDKDVYTSEILVASNLTDYTPKKLRLFSWGK
ncbi:hypothetical protein HOD75_02060 [archaeon]|jgi:hypothetical protein|nr:hypothetical protein [archaeon]MBT4241661.1 hypothetical protein [archaeon]MBT4418056.1 hypothetical protein [archaeon]